MCEQSVAKRRERRKERKRARKRESQGMRQAESVLLASSLREIGQFCCYIIQCLWTEMMPGTVPYSPAVYELLLPEMSSCLLNSSRKKKNEWPQKKDWGSLMVFRLWSTNPNPYSRTVDVWQKKIPPLFLIPLKILLPVSQLVVGRLSCSNQPWRTELV